MLYNNNFNQVMLCIMYMDFTTWNKRFRKMTTTLAGTIFSDLDILICPLTLMIGPHPHYCTSSLFLFTPYVTCPHSGPNSRPAHLPSRHPSSLAPSAGAARPSRYAWAPAVLPFPPCADKDICYVATNEKKSR